MSIGNTKEIEKQLKIANYLEMAKQTKNKYDKQHYLDKAKELLDCN